MSLCCVKKTQPQNPERSRSCTATWHYSEIRLTGLHFWFREMTLRLSISLVCLKKKNLATNQKEGLRDSSSHNTRQVLIASRLLKVNVILTFQSLSLIAFSKTLTANTCIWGHFLLDFWTANLMLSKQRSRAELQMLLWSTFAADNRVFTTTTGALPSECLFRLRQPTVNSIWWFSCTRTVLKGLMQQCGQRYFSFPIFATYPSVRW